MRRTAEEAEQTRRRIMAAALRTFDRRGIARTTLEQIAVAARVTRGAIYWHFKNKQALVRAIRNDVSLPIIDRADFTLLHDGGTEPLDRIELFLVGLIEAMEHDPRARSTFAVMSFKCEYVGVLASELTEMVEKNAHLRSALTQVYEEAGTRKQLRRGLTPSLAALETLLFLTGLFRIWLLDEHGQGGMRGQVREVVAAHVNGRRAVTQIIAGEPRKGAGEARRARSGVKTSGHGGVSRKIVS